MREGDEGWWRRGEGRGGGGVSVGVGQANGGGGRGGLQRRRPRGWTKLQLNVNINVNNLQAISESDFHNSGEPGPQATRCSPYCEDGPVAGPKLQARPSVETGRRGRTGRPSRRARSGADALLRVIPQQALHHNMGTVDILLLPSNRTLSWALHHLCRFQHTPFSGDLAC